ncbi:MAG: LysR family transcriptional regulator [Desulforhopalus sp.]
MLENLDRLKVFYHVFTQGSIVAASKTLHVSQSAVSQTIQKLEMETSTPLFIRLHKQLVPTPASERLYTIVEPFMLALDIYLKTIEQGKDHPFGELRIGAPPEFGKAYLPLVVADFRAQYQDVTFTLEFGTPEALLPLLKRGALDFALVDLFFTRSTHSSQLNMYHFQPVIEEEVILACSKKYHEINIKGDHSFTSISKQNFISYNKDQQTIKQWFGHHFSKTNIQVHDVLTVGNHEAVISAIKNDVGLGVVASHLVKKEIQAKHIVHIKTSASEIINPIALVQLQDKIPTLTEKVFKKYLVEKIRTIIPEGKGGVNIP